MIKLSVCPVDELPPGHRRIVQASENISIGVFNIDGHFHALRNICPHRKAPLCLGPITSQVTSDGPGDAQMHGPQQILRCPWHGWEFDITTGQSVFNPHKVRVKSYPVIVENACQNSPPTDEVSIDKFPVTIEAGIITVLLDNSTPNPQHK